MLAPLQLVDLAAVVDGEPVGTFRNPVVDVPLADSQMVSRSRERFERVRRAATLSVAAVAIVVPLALQVRMALAVPSAVLGVALMAFSTASLGVARRLIGARLVNE